MLLINNVMIYLGELLFSRRLKFKLPTNKAAIKREQAQRANAR